MKAIIISKMGKIEYKDVHEPEVKTGNVKIKIVAAGLCGSDIQKLLRDKKSLHAVKTRVWGHEISGIVEEVSPEIKNVKRGDAVVIDPLVRKEGGKITETSSIGKDFDGGFADYTIAPIQNVMKFPLSLKFEEAALVDGIASSLHGYHLSGLKSGANIVIFGDGNIGLNTAIICLEHKNNVTVVGKHKKNLDIAYNLGAQVIELDKVQKLKANSFDAAFEAVGGRQEETINNAIMLIRENGIIVSMGVFERGRGIKIQLRNLFYKEGKLIGSNSYGTFNGVREFESALVLLKTKKAEFADTITHILPLSSFNHGLELIQNKNASGAIKIIFRP